MDSVKNQTNAFAVWDSKARIATNAFATRVVCTEVAKNLSIAFATKVGAVCFAIKVRFQTSWIQKSDLKDLEKNFNE